MVTLFNIQKFSIHDGPGIRTTLFFKGCPLSCAWCHNPESHNKLHQLMFHAKNCTGCGLCVQNCPNQAISIVDGVRSVANEKCLLCKRCVEHCPSQTIEYVGTEYTIKEAIAQILKDQLFYDESGGGVTFSGGEALSQPEALEQIAKLCRTHEIHTALETSLCFDWERIERIAPYIDLFLVDIKSVSDDIHKQYVGVSNHMILENVKKLSQLGKRIWIRLPIIPTINDGEENIAKTIAFLKTISFEQANLLAYHSMGKGKYTKLGKQYTLDVIEPPSTQMMERLSQQFASNGFNMRIGG